jgi:hypothetical protein
MILILSLVSLVIIILRDGGYLNLRLYRSYINSSVSSNWSNATGTVILPKREMRRTPCPGEIRLKDLPLQIHCLGYKHGESGTDNCLPVSVFIDHIDHGPLWIPLYKNVAFNCNIPLSRALETYRQKGDSMQLSNYMISGTITLNGNLTITGFCSYRDAERLLAGHVMSRVYNTVRDQLGKQQ